MSLKDIYAPYFKIGTSVNKDNMESDEAKAELRKHYNSITAENGMKPMHMMDWKENLENPKQYHDHAALNFSIARKYLGFARESGIPVRGHTLVWHNQTPLWFFKEEYSMDEEAPLASRETMLVRMENYIRDVLTFVQTEYPGVIYAWDVVNEAIEEREQEGWRHRSLWFKTVGEDFVLQAFRLARKYADPQVKLFYNDYNTFNPFKRDAITDLILKPLMAEKLVDGMGMQTHLVLDDRIWPEYEKSLQHYGSLGLEIQITELDIHNPDPSEAGEQKLAEAYERLFTILTNAKKEQKINLTTVTFWGMKDDESWLTEFRKEQSYPMLFGDNYLQKAAYYAVVRVAQKQ